jgi:hypothetical protein
MINYLSRVLNSLLLRRRFLSKYVAVDLVEPRCICIYMCICICLAWKRKCEDREDMARASEPSSYFSYCAEQKKRWSLQGTGPPRASPCLFPSAEKMSPIFYVHGVLENKHGVLLHWRVMGKWASFPSRHYFERVHGTYARGGGREKKMYV